MLSSSVNWFPIFSPATQYPPVRPKNPKRLFYKNKEKILKFVFVFM